jgi:16S rRNA (guanine(1405)-N(7))-methyltransferase
MAIDAAEVAARAGRLRACRLLCPETIRRVAKAAAEGATSTRQAVRQARRQLRDVYVPYLRQWDPRQIELGFREISGPAAGEHARSVYRWILERHSSTRDRVAFVGQFYTRIFELTGQPESVTDIGCGLAPFALPWMNLPAEAAYRAWDIDARLIELLRSFFSVCGVGGRAECRDVLCGLPEEPADVVFLLKMLPYLEQQDRGCSSRLLRELRGGFVVTSFGTGPHGGRGRPASDYARQMEGLLAQEHLTASKLEFPAELVYVIDKRS